MPTRLAGNGNQADPCSAHTMLYFACSSCSKALKIRINLAGRKIKCPRCGEVVPVPQVKGPATPPAPRTRFPLFPLLFLTVTVMACAIYANLAFAVTRPANFCYFPPFLANVNANWNRGMGHEYLNIARALAAGQGYAHPFGGKTGPTAWQPPVYPTLLAVLLWLSEGNVTFAMTVVICLSALVRIGTGLLILILVAQTTQRIGLWTVTVVYLLALCCNFEQCFQRTHDVWLILLSLNVLFAGLCWVRPFQAGRLTTSSVLLCLGWGLFGGLCAQITPVAGLTWGMLSLLVGLQQRAWSRLALALLAAVLTLAPWTVRNYLVFDRLIPMKSNLAFELYQSQCLQRDGLLQNFNGHPGEAGGPEGREYRSLGEAAYMDRKRHQFWQAVWNDPEEYLDRAASRLLATTVWYVPFNRPRDAKQPWILWISRLTHPLPFLALVVLLFTGMRDPLRASQWIAIGIYCVYLLPYIGASYYDRYAAPLLGVKVLLVLWAIDRLLALWRKTGAMELRPA